MDERSEPSGADVSKGIWGYLSVEVIHSLY
jgi:hypothetical protein